jgi:hypothetical protein
MSNAQENSPSNPATFMRQAVPATGRLNTKSQRKKAQPAPAAVQAPAKQTEAPQQGFVGTMGSHTKP